MSLVLALTTRLADAAWPGFGPFDRDVCRRNPAQIAARHLASIHRSARRELFPTQPFRRRHFCRRSANTNCSTWPVTADVWSLGVILYELITSQRPFDAANPDAVSSDSQFEPAVAVRSYRPEIDQSLEAIVMTCLSKDRASRYSTAAALADDLDRWLDGRPVRAQLKPISRLPVRLADNPRRPRNRILIVLGMLIALGIGVFGIASYSAKTKGDDGIDWSSSVPTEEKLKWVETRLARGESVDLVPTSHNPRWFRLLSFDGKPLRFAEGSKPFALSGTDTVPALLEICRDPQTDNYVFEATLRQTETSRAAGSRVGLFCGYESLTNANGNQTTLQWEVTFNDLIERRDGGIVVSVIMARQQEPARVQINQFMLNPAKVRFAPKGDPNRKERRKLKAQLLNGIMKLFSRPVGWLDSVGDAR